MTDYKALSSSLQSLIHGIPHTVANLANASALLYHTLEDINWAGFYLAKENMLVLGPFQGKVACIEIPFDKGVCGFCASQGKTCRVDNVHKFPGHIACDGASNSEIVIPIFKNGALFGVLDIDSPVFSRFTDLDEKGLEEFVRVLETEL